jgi:hypothetical protein
MELQRNVPLAALSESLRPLFDPARAVPADVWFLPYQTDMNTFVFDLVVFGLIVGGAFGLSGIFGIVVLTVYILSGTDKANDFGDIVVYVVVYLALAGLVVTCWRNFWRPLWTEAVALREKRAHRLRRGLFLTPDAMIVRRQTDRYDVLPRDAILSAELRGYRRATLYVIFRMPDGGQKSYDLSGAVPWGNIDHHSALFHVQKWARSAQHEVKPV